MPRTGNTEDLPAPTKACTDQRKLCLRKGTIIILILILISISIIIIIFVNVSECSSSGGRTPYTWETPLSLV